MKKSFLWVLCGLLCLALLVGTARAAEEEETSPVDDQDGQHTEAQETPQKGVVEEKVSKIYGSDWYSIFDKHKFALVLFHDPTACGELCTKAVTSLESAARELYRTLDDQEAAAVSAHLHIGHADCSRQVKLCNKYNKKQFSKPVMSLFSRAVEVLEYDGVFDRVNILDFMEKFKNAVFVYSPDEAPETSGAVVYGVFQEFNSKAPSQEYILFMKAAAHYFAQKMPEKITFVLSTAPEKSKELAARFKIAGASKLVLTEHGNTHIYDGSGDFESLKQWIFTISVPALVKADGSDGSYAFWKQQKPVFLCWLDYSAANDDFLKMLGKIAEKYRGKAFFLYEDGTKVAKHMKWFGYSGEKFPAIIAFDTRPHTKGEYSFDENKELSEESIEQFVEDVIGHKLKKHIRKQPVPKEDTGVVKTLVYDNFRHEVLESPKDVVVFYYVPSCTFCMDFLADFEKLAASLRDVSTLAFGKIDLDQNESPPPTAVRSFPTVLMFAQDSKYQYEFFNRPRTREDLITFMKETATNPFEVPVMLAADDETDLPDEDEAEKSPAQTLRDLRDQIHH